MEAPPRESPVVPPDLAGGLQQAEGPDQVGLDEGRRSKDRAVNVVFGREVNQGVDAMVAQQPFRQLPVADVALYEGVTVLAG